MNIVKRSKIDYSTSKRRGAKRYQRVKKDSLIEKGQNDGKTVKIGLNALGEQLLILSSKAHVQIDSLGPENSNRFKKCMEILNMISNLPPSSQTQSVYEKISAAFADKDENGYKPGTVGAYFRGCFVNSNFGGRSGCSATCAGMLQPANDMNGVEVCEQSVIHYKNRVFEIQHMGVRSDEVIIHILDNNFVGFSNMEIQQLRKEGYTKAALYLYNDNDNYTVEQNFVDIQSLPRRDRRDTDSTDNHRRQHARSDLVVGKKAKDDNDSSNWWWWIIIIVIIIFFLIILCGGFYYIKNNKNKYNGSRGVYYSSNLSA